MAEQPDLLDRELIGSILTDAGVQPVGAGNGTLLGEPVLILYQWSTDLSEGLHYSIASPTGQVVARCHEMVTERLDPAEASWGQLMDQNNTDLIGLADPSGARWGALAHKKVWKSKVTLTGVDGREIGTITQENVMGKVRLGLAAGGQGLGKVVSDNTQLLGFTVKDAAKNDVGRVTKLGRYSRPGLLGPSKVLGCYVLQLHGRPAGPLHIMAVVAPLAIDLAFSVAQAGQRSLGRTLTGGD